MIIDIILILIFAATVFVGVKRGFVSSVLELLAVLASLFFAYLFSDSFSAWLYNNFVEGKIINSVTSLIPTSLSRAAQTSGVEVTLNNIKDTLGDALAPLTSVLNINFNELFKDVGNISVAGMSTHEIAQTITQNVIEPIASKALYWISFAILFFVFSFAFRLIVMLIEKIIKMTPFKGANGLLGGLLGVVKGIITVFVLVIILKVIASVNAVDANSNSAKFTEMINDSKIVEVVYDHNPFSK